MTLPNPPRLINGEPIGFRGEEDGRVAVTALQVVRDLAGRVVADEQVTHVYRFEDGLVRDMEIRH